MPLSYQVHKENLLLLLTLESEKHRSKELAMLKNRWLEGFQAILIQNTPQILFLQLLIMPSKMQKQFTFVDKSVMHHSWRGLATS